MKLLGNDWLIAMIFVLVCMGVLAVQLQPTSLAQSRITDPCQMTAMNRPQPISQAMWIAPSNGQSIHGPIHFAARVKPILGGKPIRCVQFTVSWNGRGGSWLIACRLFKPTHGNVYECIWDPTKEVEQVPEGELHVSFDVVTLTAHHNSPNGIHTISWQKSMEIHWKELLVGVVIGIAITM